MGILKGHQKSVIYYRYYFSKFLDTLSLYVKPTKILQRGYNWILSIYIQTMTNLSVFRSPGKCRGLRDPYPVHVLRVDPVHHLADHLHNDQGDHGVDRDKQRMMESPKHCCSSM